MAREVVVLLLRTNQPDELVLGGPGERILVCREEGLRRDLFFDSTRPPTQVRVPHCVRCLAPRM